jgi:hypothetical protein
MFRRRVVTYGAGRGVDLLEYAGPKECEGCGPARLSGTAICAKDGFKKL